MFLCSSVLLCRAFPKPVCHTDAPRSSDNNCPHWLSHGRCIPHPVRRSGCSPDHDCPHKNAAQKARCKHPKFEAGCKLSLRQTGRYPFRFLIKHFVRNGIIIEKFTCKCYNVYIEMVETWKFEESTSLCKSGQKK